MFITLKGAGEPWNREASVRFGDAVWDALDVRGARAVWHYLSPVSGMSIWSHQECPNLCVSITYVSVNDDRIAELVIEVPDQKSLESDRFLAWLGRICEQQKLSIEPIP